MGRKRQAKRQDTITPDALKIDPALLGMSLATVPRRAVAMALDLLIIMLFSLMLLAVTVYILINKHSPDLIPTFLSTTQVTSAEKDSVWHQLEFEAVKLVNERMPDRLSDDFKFAMAEGDTARVHQLVREYDFDFFIHFGDESITQFNALDKTVVLDLHPFMGTTSFIFNIVSLAILYFTLVTWWMKGTTPGKWLMKIRVLHLNGTPLKIWHTFERAGGYTASLATLGLGFAEAIWHPNRQTVHDRISGTVVVDLRKPNA